MFVASHTVFSFSSLIHSKNLFILFQHRTKETDTTERWDNKMLSQRAERWDNKFIEF